MEKCKFILLIFVLPLFVNGSCEKRNDECFITIQNNSDKEIIFQGSLHTSLMQDSMCFTPMTKIEYEDFIYSRLTKPYLSRRIEIGMIIKKMQTYPDVVWYVGIFNRIDIDTMSCEEFKQKYPLKKEWQITLADLEACGFNMVLEYTPE